VFQDVIPYRLASVRIIDVLDNQLPRRTFGLARLGISIASFAAVIAFAKATHLATWPAIIAGAAVGFLVLVAKGRDWWHVFVSAFFTFVGVFLGAVLSPAVNSTAWSHLSYVVGGAIFGWLFAALVIRRGE
jgi:hypothetical protein